jgi:hypothetical protein
MVAIGEGYSPLTAAGRVTFLGLCIIGVIFVAAYTANLASFFFTQTTALRTITSISDFSRYGKAACVRGKSTAHIAFMKVGVG